MSNFEGPGYAPDAAPTQVAPPPPGGVQMPYGPRGYGQSEMGRRASRGRGG